MIGLDGRVTHSSQGGVHHGGMQPDWELGSKGRYFGWRYNGSILMSKWSTSSRTPTFS
jgi:hypothetical protein